MSVPSPQLSSVVKEDVSNILAKCRGEIEALRGSTVLITGSTGFLARELTEALLLANQNGADIKLVLTSRDPGKVSKVFGDRLGPGVEVIPVMDVGRYAGRVDRIVHAASPCDPRVNNESPFRTIVDIGTLTHETISLGLRNHLENFLLLSSGAVYGVQPPDMRRVSEEYLGAPDINSKESCYGEAKRISELMLTSSGLPFTILRGFTFIGPNQDLSSGFAAPEFILSAIRDKRIVIKGDGRPIRTFCYESDLAVMLLKTLVHARNTTMNAGNDRPEITIWELAEIVARKVGEVEIVVEGKPKAGLPPRYVPNIDRMRSYYVPTVNVESGIARVVRHIRETKALD
ncbi:MAG: NAD-dependent epimerase/dehydratase family protein [Methanomassiliicoccales archaeon]